MPDLGVRLQLLLGASVPTPAPFSVVEDLTAVEVTNNDRERDGFQLTFSLGRQGASPDYRLLREGWVDPPTRGAIIVIIQGMPQVLINGIITKHQVTPSNQPGQSQLRVTGEDTGLQLDYKDRDEVYRNMPDSAIVTTILGSYSELTPLVTPTTDVPLETDRVVTQQGTDLSFIQELAHRNGFVFYTEPGPVPGQSFAYWGPKHRPGVPQAALTVNMGSWTNVEDLSFDYDALRSVVPEASVLEPLTGLMIPIPVPGLLSPSMAGQAAQALRTRKLRDTANLSPIQAALRMLQVAGEGEETAQGTGHLETTRYGQALRSRRTVGVRGAGEMHDGTYYVQRVTHNINITGAEYTQSFSLTREGRGATSPSVSII